MSRSSSKAINTDTSYDDEFDDESSGEDDQLAFISRKIGTHGRKGVDQTGKDSRNHIEKERAKIKVPPYAMSVRNQDTSSQNTQTLISQITRKDTSNKKNKKVLMSTWEELDDTFFDEETKEEE